MTKRTLLAAVLLAGSAIAAQAAEMILYESPGFSGRQLTLRGYMPDINSFGFNDRASSIAVRSGVWEVCTDAEFRGFCATLQPGEYRVLDPRFNDRISSAREVTAQTAETPPRYEPQRIEPQRIEPRAMVELFGQSGFRGRSLAIERSTPDLEEFGFNDRATSLIVREGTWQLCSDSGYRGTCRTFEPGRYADIGPGLAREISSARLLTRELPPQTRVTPPPSLPVEMPRIVLFDNDMFRGRSLVVSDEQSDLRRSSFNDDAASLMVESGNWEVCTEAYYRGQCRVLSPGQYRRLDTAIYRSISSVRPVGVAMEPRYRPAQASIELFQGINFDGSRFTAAGDVPNLDARGFNDRASSMIIHEGRWEVCADAGYNGRCAVYGPGRYSDLRQLNNEVSSLRRVN
jgi:hypothetical protein